MSEPMILKLLSLVKNLKLGNAVVEFVGIEDEKNERRMKIKVADLTISAPIEYFSTVSVNQYTALLEPV